MLLVILGDAGVEGRLAAQTEVMRGFPMRDILQKEKKPRAMTENDETQQRLSLSDAERQRVRTIVLDALRPGATADTPMEAFKKMFAFITNDVLRDHLAEAYYQARLANRLSEILDLPGGFPHLFLKTQLVHYASIFEAVIDHYLEPYKSDFTTPSLSRISALASGVTLSRDGRELVVAERTQRVLPLRDVSFQERLRKAVDLGIVHDNQKDIIRKTYDARNKIHLLAAARDDYKPKKKLVMQAYSEVPHFLDQVKMWLKKQPAKP